MKDMAAKGRAQRLRGSDAAAAKLTEADVAYIRDMRGKAYQKELARRFGVDSSTISSIQTRRAWSYNPDERLAPEKVRGERQHSAKLTELQVREIRSLRGKATNKELAERFGVSRNAISKIHLRQSWTHV